MASTMTIPHLAALPNFPGTIPTPLPGTVPVSIPGGYPGHIPIAPQGPVMSAPVANGANNPSTTISQPIQTLRVPVVPVGGGCYNDGMEVVWHGEFSRLFSSFFPPHVWYLSITNSAPSEKWKFCRDSAKVRFCCQDCGNGWTSMKGRVTFWFHLNLTTNEGFVQFKLYGQVCKKCNSGKFEYVMWYPEEVSKVMCNLYNKVGQTYYGFMQPPIRIDRRPGRPRNQHNAELCQACRDGECDQGRPIKAMYNFLPPNPNGQQPNQALPPRSQVPPQSVATVIQPPMPVVIRQPPPPRHVLMQPPINTSSALLTVHGQTASTGAHLITPPVTLSSGAQPILTYSIVTGTIKEGSKLSAVSESFTPNQHETVDSKKTDGTSATSQPSTTLVTPQNAPDKPATASTKMLVSNGEVSERKISTEVPSPKVKQNGVAAPTKGENVPQKTAKPKDPEANAKEIPGSKKEEKVKANLPLVNGYAAAAAANGRLVSKPKVLPQVNGITAV